MVARLAYNQQMPDRRNLREEGETRLSVVMKSLLLLFHFRRGFVPLLLTYPEPIGKRPRAANSTELTFTPRLICEKLGMGLEDETINK